MNVALALFGIPFLTYLALVVLPRGRITFIGFGLATLIAALVWVRQIASVDSVTVAITTLVFSAIALAGLVQILRSALGPGRPKWVYPLIVVLGLLGAGLPLFVAMRG